MLDVIWLNGTASSGKTTLARALQQRLEEPFLWASIDRFAGMLPDRSFESLDAFNRDIEPVVCGFHWALVALLDAGNRLIVDHVLRDRSWLPECVRLFNGHDVLFVGVHCAPEVLDAREAERGEQVRGLARRQLEAVHDPGIYDVEVDTSASSLEQCVESVLAAYGNPPRPTAFEKLSKLAVQPGR